MKKRLERVCWPLKPKLISFKAAGGVRTLEDVNAMIEAGANRIGTSGGVALMTQTEMKTAY
ncbi:MAG: hypothetical protein FD133_1412 [Erysipelotrichaceae bacterium]|nr:MAG: hypothetical protein FD133_1412 [Erysipelotrichaceae bacterium]